MDDHILSWLVVEIQIELRFNLIDTNMSTSDMKIFINKFIEQTEIEVFG